MKYLVLVATIVGLFFAGCASTSNGNNARYQSKQIQSNWIADQNGCKRWNPYPILNETITWTGKCNNGYINGYGTLIWYKNGKVRQKDIGEYKNGKKNGKVTVYEPLGENVYGFNQTDRQLYGNIFVGNVINDVKSGKGTVFYENGNKEIGKWINGKRQGRFTFFTKSGINYKIKYKNNILQPYWIKDQNGCKRWNPNPKENETVTWSGGCVDGYLDGYGTLTWYKGSAFTNNGEDNELLRRGKPAKDEVISFSQFIKSNYHENFKDKKVELQIDKEKPYIHFIIKRPYTKIKLLAIENKNDIICTKDTETYTRRLGAMEQLMTLGTSSKATVTEYQHTCKFQNGYKNRMKNLITQLNPSNLSSALKTLEGMEHWRSVSTSENWGIKEFFYNAMKNGSSRNSSYSSSSTTTRSNSKKVETPMSCSYKVENKRGNNTIIKCSDGHRADIKFRKNKWRRTTGMLSGYYDSFEEAANKECGCID